MANNGMKVCPYCAEEIKAAAKVCRFCKMDLATGKPMEHVLTSGSAPAEVKARSSVRDGVKLGCGMFIVLPILLFVILMVFLFVSGKIGMFFDDSTAIVRSSTHFERYSRSSVNEIYRPVVVQALKLYKLDNGRYPTTIQGVKALLERSDREPVPTNWRDGGYIDKETLRYVARYFSDNSDEFKLVMKERDEVVY